MTRFDAAMERRLDPRATAPLAVALSGGGDSLALLHLTVEWARPRGRPVLALTVDHALNPLSPHWTRDAGEKARRLGCGWRALVWTGPKPVTGLQAKARAARHALLAEAARAAGVRVLLMGHTLDDVAEGEAMRAADAPGLGRLREWSPSPAWPEGRGVMLLRPLLAVRRAALRTVLTDRGEAWLEDPANEDPRFARVRARRALTGAAPSVAAIDLDPAVTALAHHFGLTDAGMHAPLDALLQAPGAAAKPALAAALLSVSGGTRPPRGHALGRLLAALAEGRTAALCGCRVAGGDGQALITRAAPRRGQAARAPEPADWIWGRFAAACGLYPDEASLPQSWPPRRTPR